MKTTAIVIAILAIFALPHLAFAQVCVSSTAGTPSATTVTTGTDFSISITPASSESGCTVSTLSLTGTPTSYTISDPPASQSNQYSGFAAGTTKTFTLSAGSAGTYTFTATATTSGGSRSDSAGIVSAIDPSTLTTTATPSSAQLNLTQAFTLTVAITGSSSAAVTTSYSLSVPSGLTASGDPTSKSDQSVAANSTTSITWTINHTTCFTGAKTVTFALGSNSNAASVSVTGNTTCDTGSGGGGSSGGGGGGGGGGGAVSAAATVKISFIKAGNTSVITSGLKTSTTTVKRIEIAAAKSVFAAVLTIEKNASRPATARSNPPAQHVYNYVIISRENITDADVSSAKIDFEVPKSWLSDTGIDKNAVALYRYTKDTDTWAKLATALESETDTAVTYRADSPGLSVFAIGGEKAAGGGPPAQEPETAPSGGEPGQPGQPGQQTGQEAAAPPPGAQAGGQLPEAVVILVVLVVVIAMGAVYYELKKKSKPKYEYQKKYAQRDK